MGRLLRWFGLVLAVFAAGLLSAAPQPADPGGGARLPGGVADPSGRTGYVAAAGGGIDALDLVTGDVLWHIDEPARPLLLVGDRLFAQAGFKRNRLRILAFDVSRKGECVLESDAVVLPAWVVVGEAAGHAFKARWRHERGHLHLSWEARAWYAGPRPTPELEAEARRQARGAARIDLTTGKVEEVDEGPPPPVAAPRELDRLTVRWQGAVGASYKALVLEEDGLEQKLVLRSWAAGGQAEPEKELLRGRRLMALPTVDERYLCVRDAFPSPDLKPIGEDRFRFGWSVFAVDSGERVERAPFDAGTQALALVGTRLYTLVAGPVRGPLDRPFLQPRTLKAVDLKSGKVLWERPVEGKLVLPPPS